METAQFNDWKFSSLQTHISLSTEIDELAKQLRFVPPEQLYLSNFLKFEHPRVQIRFSAQDALQTVPHDDWTFIPRNYFGKFERDGVDLEKVDDENAKIDMDLLMKKDPILFYSSVVLFEDELHDHGHCTLSVKTVSYK
jgi:type 2A phosphatase activator TIP41